LGGPEKSTLLSAAACLLLAYGGAFSADALLGRHAPAEQLAVDAPDEHPSVSELTEGISPE
jgi:hypothetical protein